MAASTPVPDSPPTPPSDVTPKTVPFRQARSGAPSDTQTWTKEKALLVVATPEQKGSLRDGERVTDAVRWVEVTLVQAGTKS